MVDFKGDVFEEALHPEPAHDGGGFLSRDRNRVPRVQARELQDLLGTEVTVACDGDTADDIGLGMRIIHFDAFFIGTKRQRPRKGGPNRQRKQYPSHLQECKYSK